MQSKVAESGGRKPPPLPLLHLVSAHTYTHTSFNPIADEVTCKLVGLRQTNVPPACIQFTHTPLNHHRLLALHHQEKHARPAHASHTASSVHAMFVGGGPHIASLRATRQPAQLAVAIPSTHSNTINKGSMRAFHSADSKPPWLSHGIASPEHIKQEVAAQHTSRGPRLRSCLTPPSSCTQLPITRAGMA